MNLAKDMFYLRKVFGSLEISVVDTRILGCERGYVRSHPKIRPFSWQILENQFFSQCVGMILMLHSLK